MKHELLAPAGDAEAGYAALYYGADAVYLGLQKFSARATATNFDEPTLDAFTAYAHHLKRKVYVALNTVLQENELAELIEALDICSRCKVDALIIQDLGVARVVRESYPELEMHASTQMAVHNREGALYLKKLGFSRVVLARELTLDEIKDIAAIPDLETEAFIHGALCYSYSGLCQFSSLETGRSANRGKCLYPCRACFTGDLGNKHIFSMKDMALKEDVLKMPVTSLKIEGRKKSALYVAAVTDYYRRILDGKGADAHREENIKQIFSRPWCKFHFNGKNKDIIDSSFVGHRGLPIGQIKKMGNLKELASMIPGIGKMLKDVDIDDNAFKSIEAIIYSMTPAERSNPAILNGSRRTRIAKGSGTSIQEVNKLLKQFDETRKMMKMLTTAKAGGKRFPMMPGFRR